MITLQDLFGRGLTRSQRMQQSFWKGMNYNATGGLADIGLIAFQVNRAGRGSVVPAILGQGFAMIPGTVIAGVASAGLCLIPGIGPVTAAIMGQMLAGYGELRMGAALANPIRMFTGLNKSVRHLEMGGNYKDTEFAQRQRYIALQDMSSAMIPGRRYLGQEALLLHR